MEHENPYASPVAESPQAPSGVRPEERTWGLLAHLSGLLIFTAVPFANIVGPLIIWLIQKDKMPFVDDQGKEALNFQISATIYIFVSGLLCLAVVGFVLLPVAILFQLIFTIIAALKANDGVAYRYLMCMRIVS